MIGDLTGDGKISLGDAPGIVTVNGILVAPIRGTNAATPDFGQLAAAGYGQITLAGTLSVEITDGYAPPIGAAFPFSQLTPAVPPNILLAEILFIWQTKSCPKQFRNRQIGPMPKLFPTTPKNI